MFTVSTNCKSIGGGKYNLTLTPSQTSTIYYTRDGSIPTTSSAVYKTPLTIYNNTWVRFFAQKSNQEKTPVLSYGLQRATLPYINSKPIVYGSNYKVNLVSSQPSTIYYTVNGEKHTTKSYKYTGTLQINNNSLLQYFAITTSNNKQSNTYYYKVSNPTAYVTVLNTSNIANNQQKLLIIGNKPGKIYYTLKWFKTYF